MFRGDRALLRLLAVLLAFALVAAACGGDDDTAVDNEPTEATDDGSADGTGDDDGTAADDSAEAGDDAVGVQDIEDAAAETDPIPGGVLRYRINADVDGLNPTTSALSAPGLTMANAVFDTLAAFDVDGNAVPYLAESFTPNEDNTSWTVKLREGVMFHDGTPLNADAAIFNSETMRNDPLLGLTVKPFVDPDNPIEKVDDLTYTVNLIDPNLYWPASMATQVGMVASPAWLQAALDDPELNQQPVGTGPFMFDSRVQDSQTRFVRNESWWNGAAYLDAIEFVPVTDADVAVTLFKEDQLDGMHNNDPAAIDVLLNEPGLQNALDDTSAEQLDMMNSQAPPFDDIRARRALTLATPQNNYVALLGVGVTERADGPFSKSTPYYDPDLVQETDRPDEAAALAAEYCADVPENCTGDKINIERLTSGPSVNQTREAELLAEGWSVAFNTTLKEVFEDAIIQTVALGLYQVVDWRQFDAVDPSNDNVFLLCRTIGGISLNWPRFCDEERDAILLQAQNEPDPAARAELYKEFARKINQDYLYIFHTHTLWVISYREGVNGACARVAPDGTELRCQERGITWFDSVWLDQ